MQAIILIACYSLSTLPYFHFFQFLVCTLQFRFGGYFDPLLLFFYKRSQLGVRQGLLGKYTLLCRGIFLLPSKTARFLDSFIYFKDQHFRKYIHRIFHILKITFQDILLSYMEFLLFLSYRVQIRRSVSNLRS